MNASKIELQARLETLTYDKNYQDIECLGIQGYDPSEPSWLKIVNNLGVEFAGKTVCDLGCFHGYYAIKAKEAGAISVIGLDRSEEILATARMISKASDVHVDYALWESQEASPSCDIALLLNMLHHCPDPHSTLRNLKCEEAVFEINEDQLPLVETYFDVMEMAEGRTYPHRESRLLIHGLRR